MENATCWSEYKHNFCERERMLAYRRAWYRRSPAHRRATAYKLHPVKGSVAKPGIETLKRHNLLEWWTQHCMERAGNSAERVLQQQDGLWEREGHVPASEEAGRIDHPAGYESLPEETRYLSNEG